MPSNPQNNPSFPTTRWSLVIQIRDGDPDQVSDALDEICEHYWYPVYAFLRRRGNPPQNAEDLTQDLFQRLVSSESLKTADPEKGRLRNYLIANLKQVASRASRKRMAQKRGGDAPVVPIEGGEGERRYALEDEGQCDAETLFDRAWANGVYDLAKAALREAYEKRDRGALLEALEPHISWNETDGDYAEIAGRLGITESAVRVHVFRMRRRLRKNLEDEILKTLSDPDDLEDELRYLLTLVGSTGL